MSNIAFGRREKGAHLYCKRAKFLYDYECSEQPKRQTSLSYYGRQFERIGEDGETSGSHHTHHRSEGQSARGTHHPCTRVDRESLVRCRRCYATCESLDLLAVVRRVYIAGVHRVTSIGRRGRWWRARCPLRSMVNSLFFAHSFPVLAGSRGPSPPTREREKAAPKTRKTRPRWLI